MAPVPADSRLFPTSSHRDLSDGFRRTRVSRVSPRWCRLRWPVGELGAVSLGLGSVCGARMSWSRTLPPCVTPGSHKPLQDSASQEPWPAGHLRINRHMVKLQVRMR